MPSLVESYPDLRDALMARYGRPASPGGSTAAGLDVSGLLRLALDATVADRALARLLDRLEVSDLLDPATLAAIDPKELAAELVAEPPPLVLPPKTLVLIRALAAWIEQAGGLDALATRPTEALRDELRAIRGLGPGTVDRVLLLGFGRAAFSVDRPAYRVLARHGWVDPSAGYDEAREVVEGLAADDAPALADLSRWLDRLAAEFCRAGTPRCDQCPLRPVLPPSGPIEPGD